MMSIFNSFLEPVSFLLFLVELVKDNMVSRQPDSCNPIAI